VSEQWRTRGPAAGRWQGEGRAVCCVARVPLPGLTQASPTTWSHLLSSHPPPGHSPAGHQAQSARPPTRRRRRRAGIRQPKVKGRCQSDETNVQRHGPGPADRVRIVEAILPHPDVPVGSHHTSAAVGGGGCHEASPAAGWWSEWDGWQQWGRRQSADENRRQYTPVCQGVQPCPLCYALHHLPSLMTCTRRLACPILPQPYPLVHKSCCGVASRPSHASSLYAQPLLPNRSLPHPLLTCHLQPLSRAPRP
jgi:hypothetical protein